VQGWQRFSVHLLSLIPGQESLPAWLIEIARYQIGILNKIRKKYRLKSILSSKNNVIRVFWNIFWISGIYTLSQTEKRIYYEY
jgi:hypothetical protein